MTQGDIINILKEVVCPPFEILVGGHREDHLWIQAKLFRQDAETGGWAYGTGGKYLLSEHMTRGEIVKKAFVACRDFAEHEVRERFKWRGRAILGPHIDVEALWEIADRHESRTPK